MGVSIVPAADAVPRLAEYDAVIDVRSPAEFADDHLPGAVNWPVLDDAQRHEVGTLYKQVSPLEARKAGAALVARNIAAHLERGIGPVSRDWKPLVYCWRGGQRSGALAWFLGQIGFRTAQLGGGYKAYREGVRRELEALPAALDLRVLCGRTGSGKTRLLQALKAEGAQVLDLEALASHRGSVLGGLPGEPQPSQRRFDSLLWRAMKALDLSKPVFIESESRKIGRIQVPEALLVQMRDKGQCLRIEMPMAARVRLLLEDYAFFADDPEAFAKLLDPLLEVRGKALVQAWQQAARDGQWAPLFGDLMREHYDPLYDRSMGRNFKSLADAPLVELADGEAEAMRAAARALLGTQGG